MEQPAADEEQARLTTVLHPRANSLSLQSTITQEFTLA